MSRERNTRSRYLLGINGAISAGIMSLNTLCSGIYSRLDDSRLAWTQAAVALYMLCVFMSLPRRPSVYFRGKPVDEANGASLLSKLTFTWCHLHRPGAGIPAQIHLQDLPVVAHKLRAQTLQERYQTRASGSSLWRQIMAMFLPEFLHQWLLVLLKALSEFGTRLVLYGLLKHLERGTEDVHMLWMCASGLSVGLLAEAIVKGWLTWVTHMKLEMPIIVLLNTLVFDKMLRKQLANGTQQSQSEGTLDKQQQQSMPSLADIISNERYARMFFAAQTFTHRLPSSTVSQACGFSHHFLMASLNLLLDVMYLTQVLGIKSILSGAASAAVLFPISTRLSDQHRRLQDELSNTHARLSNVASEALNGLRQIRLSSTERIWERRILDLRSQELNKLWKAGLTLAWLTLVANLGPIFLASVALSVHALERGNLLPSVAFASLSLFDNLHDVFRSLPFMVSNMRESWVSCQRIQRYLDEPEQRLTAVPHDTIFMENASLTWPSNSNTPHPPIRGFELSNVSLAFPKAQLSIITGETGSGKSLLIAAILGEATVEAQRFGRPASETADSQSAGKSTTAEHIALVSQPPWIENTTLRDNILFGYPFDEARYRKTLFACALDEDLNALPDGDLTKAGIKGANLSGGQKWRLALARALYSPAKVLVLEDVLSAVDPPVARWLCDHALTGELAQGRTRILATHKPHLCVSVANYLVCVRDRTAAGSRNLELLRPAQATASSCAEVPTATSCDSKATPKTASPRDKKQLLGVTRSNWQILAAYISASSGIRAYILGMLVTLCHQASSASHSLWLARWTGQRDGDRPRSLSYGISVYLILSLANGFFVFVQSVAFNSIGVAASSRLFQQMIGSVLSSPLEWISNTPLGRVLHSLGDDMYLLDHRPAALEVNNLMNDVARLTVIALTR